MQKPHELHCITVTAHEIQVIIAVDSRYNLTVGGHSFVADPSYVWSAVKTHVFSVNGNGPWLVAVEALDTDNIAGFIGAVYVDGVLKAASGVTGSELSSFKTSLTSTAGWNQLNSYDDSLWSQPALCTTSQISMWGSWVSNFQNVTNTTASPVWAQSCSNINTQAYFRATVSV